MFDVVSRGELEVKGKGLMHTYWLLGCHQEDVQTEFHGIIRKLKRNNSSYADLASAVNDSRDGSATPSTPGGLGMAEFRVLIVDDSSAQRKLVSHSLKSTGLSIDVRLADSAEMAMQMLRITPYSMVFIDFNLSSDADVMDGRGLVELLRSSPEGQGTVLVGMSTSIAKYTNLFMAAGANFVIPKPFPKPPELREIIVALHSQQDSAALLSAALHEVVATSSVTTSRQILIVEDSAMQSKLMSRRLQEVGSLLSMRFDIMICTSAEKAIEAFRFNADPTTGVSRFHAALIDQQLSDVEGDMLGSDLLRSLRSSEFCQSNTLLFGCSSNFKENAATMLAAGADHVFAKPLGTAATIASTLKRFALFATH